MAFFTRSSFNRAQHRAEAAAGVGAQRGRAHGKSRPPAPGTWRYHTEIWRTQKILSGMILPWTVAKPEATYPEQALWFRQWVEVPKKSRWLRPHRHAHLVPLKPGHRSAAPDHLLQRSPGRYAGDDLEPIVLFDRARPGDRVLIAVKLMATVDRKHFNGSPMTISFSNDRPSPQDVGEELSPPRC